MVSVYYEKSFWSDLGERAARAFVTSTLSLITASQAIGILDLDFGQIVNVAGLAAVVSALTSLLAQKVGDDSASFV